MPVQSLMTVSMALEEVVSRRTHGDGLTWETETILQRPVVRRVCAGQGGEPREDHFGNPARWDL